MGGSSGPVLLRQFLKGTEAGREDQPLSVSPYVLACRCMTELHLTQIILLFSFAWAGWPKVSGFRALVGLVLCPQNHKPDALDFEF